MFSRDLNFKNTQTPRLVFSDRLRPALFVGHSSAVVTASEDG